VVENTNAMSATFTISELAKAADVPASTVRFYERRGLLEPEGRSASNYRLYSPRSLQRLRFIVAAKKVGFTLADVRTLLNVADGVTPPCREVQALIEQRLSRVRKQRQQLDNIDRHLSAWLRAC